VLIIPIITDLPLLEHLLGRAEEFTISDACLSPYISQQRIYDHVVLVKDLICNSFISNIQTLHWVFQNDFEIRNEESLLVTMIFILF